MLKKTNNRKLFIFFVLAVASLLLLTVSFLIQQKREEEAHCHNCNIVILDLDVLREDVIDCVSAYDRTPNICGFEKKSVVFKQNIAGSDMTLPSMISFETSLYPSSHGVWNELYPVDDKSYKYIGELLQAQGYSTAFMGLYKYHNKVTVRGFNEAVEVSSIFDDNSRPVEMAEKLKSTGKPYLLYLYFADLHFPYLPKGVGVLDNPYEAPTGLPRTSEEYREVFSNYLVKNYKSVFREAAIRDFPELFNRAEENKYLIWWKFILWSADREETTKYLYDAWKPYEDVFFKFIDKDNPEHILYLKNNYLSILRLVDKRISDFLAYIENKDNVDNTIVILRTDHGEEFLDHGKLEHGNNLYQELIHTPLAIKVPGIKPLVVNSLTQDIDVLPTIYDVLGMKKMQQFQGESLVPLMIGKEKSVRNYQIAQKGEDVYISSFRSGNWKLVIKQGEPIELYDLSSDVAEKDNVVKANPDTTRNLFREYKSVVDPLPNYGLDESPLPAWVDEEKRDRLKNEGYF